MSVVYLILINFLNFRNLIGFWFLGLFNNYGFVIMLSAAHDLLKEEGNNPNVNFNLRGNNSSRDCSRLSTGTILLADVIPSIIIKSLAPFLMINIQLKVATIIAVNALSFLLVSLSRNHFTLYTGVICASLGSGLGEVSFLSHTHFFQENVISSWSSGLGALV